MSNDFFKGFSTSFNTGFKEKPRTVCVKYIDGSVVEYPGITDPWRYIAKVKKMPNVKSAWIK